jgi:hypothetical protein
LKELLKLYIKLSGVARISGQGGPKKIMGGHLKQDENGKKETKYVHIGAPNNRAAKFR